jgi:hypothetical protein
VRLFEGDSFGGDFPGCGCAFFFNTQPTVKRIRDRVRKEQANRSIEDGVDLQAHLDNEITEQQLIDLMMTRLWTNL